MPLVEGTTVVALVDDPSTAAELKSLSDELGGLLCLIEEAELVLVTD